MTIVSKPDATAGGNISTRDATTRLLVPATFITTVGNTFQITAAAILVYRAERSTLSVGWLFIAVAVPQVPLSVYFGRLADRFDRRLLCVLSDLVSAVIALSLPIWLWRDGDAGAGAYLSNFLLACAAAMFMPASSALIKERVRDERIGRFNARYEMANNAGMLLAAASAGFLVSWIGPIPLLIVNALTFVVSAVMVFLIGPRPTTTTTTSPRTAGRPADTNTDANTDTGTPGAGTSDNRGTIVRLGLLYAAGNVIVVVSNALLTALILGAFQAGAGYIGVVDALAGIGFLVSAAMYGFISPKVNGLRLAMLGYLGSCLVIALEPMALWLLLAVIPISGFCFAQGRIAARTLLMRAVPDSRAGRVFGATQAFGLGYSVLATVVLATMSDRTDIRSGFWGTSLLVGATVLIAGLPLARREARRPAETPALAGSAA